MPATLTTTTVATIEVGDTIGVFLDGKPAKAVVTDVRAEFVMCITEYRVITTQDGTQHMWEATADIVRFN